MSYFILLNYCIKRKIENDILDTYWFLLRRSIVDGCGSSCGIFPRLPLLTSESIGLLDSLGLYDSFGLWKSRFVLLLSPEMEIDGTEAERFFLDANLK